MNTKEQYFNSTARITLFQEIEAYEEHILDIKKLELQEQELKKRGLTDIFELPNAALHKIELLAEKQMRDEIGDWERLADIPSSTWKDIAQFLYEQGINEEDGTLLRYNELIRAEEHAQY